MNSPILSSNAHRDPWPHQDHSDLPTRSAFSQVFVHHVPASCLPSWSDFWQRKLLLELNAGQAFFATNSLAGHRLHSSPFSFSTVAYTYSTKDLLWLAGCWTKEHYTHPDTAKCQGQRPSYFHATFTVNFLHYSRSLILGTLAVLVVLLISQRLWAVGPALLMVSKG